jgi:hypothetical protein
VVEQQLGHVVALWMGHDAKVCLKHYAQMTEDHFDRTSSGAESGALRAQKPAQQTDAGNSEESHKGRENPTNACDYANPCESQRKTEQVFSGEGGIRTLDGLSPISVFETDAFDHSATSPGANARTQL